MTAHSKRAGSVNSGWGLCPHLTAMVDKPVRVPDLIANEWDRASGWASCALSTVLSQHIITSHKEPLLNVTLSVSLNMNILNKDCLQLNRSWVVIGTRSIRDAITCLCSESKGETPALALDIEMATDESGNRVMVRCEPVNWETWITLPVREEDLYICVSGGRKIRAPLIIVARHYDRVPLRRPRLSVGNIHARDGYSCAYTGKKLSRADATVDHIQPRSRGGKDTWENLTTCDRRINTMKADRTPEEAGLRLLRQPKAPPSMPVSVSITEIKHPSWEPFLLKH